MIPNPHSIDFLSLRVRECAESVALFTDHQLLTTAEDIGFKDYLGYVLGEMLVRHWLYHKTDSEFERVLKKLLNAAGSEGPLQRRFEDSIKPLRHAPWPIEEKTLTAACRIDDLRNNGLVAWNYSCRRVREFIECDGIIPAIIGGDAIAIPFKIQTRDRGQILDWDGGKIDGWIPEAGELWKTMGQRFGVHLGCAFGMHSSLFEGAQLAMGRSFHLPLLFGASRANSEDLHPLRVVCTGKLALGKITEVDGLNEKRLLAEKIGARLFVAPKGLGIEHRSSGVDLLPLSHGMPAENALKQIWAKFNIDEARVNKRIAPLFEERRDPFSEVIEELTATFCGRDFQLKKISSWIQLCLDGRKGGARQWIYGEAGCGKSAFMAALTRLCTEEKGWKTARFFFGRSTAANETDVLRTLARQVASACDFDWDSIANQEPLDQLREVISHIAAEGQERAVLIVDGLDVIELQSNLATLVEAITQITECVWLFSGQDTPDTRRASQLPQVTQFELERLSRDGMLEFLRQAAPEMPDSLREEIVTKSRGLPQYTAVQIKEWQQGTGETDPSKLPENDSYYGQILDRAIKPRDRSESAWRFLVQPILGLLVTTRQRTALSVATIQYGLSLRQRSASLPEIEAAVGACASILRSETDPFKESTKEGSLWTIGHDGCRAFLNGDASMQEHLKQAREVWKEVCLAWDGSEVESGAKRYALRFVIVELLENKEHNRIIALAESRTFLREQADRIGAQLSLDTLSLAIKLAFHTDRFADVAALTIARAEWGRQEYAGSPLDALRTHGEARALAIIAWMENQNDRTLWHLALAAHYANAERPDLAAQILDEHIPPSALREKLSGGRSMCAASLLCLLEGVRTFRFQWRWFLSQLDDGSKAFASRTLIRLRHNNAAWSMIGSIRDEEMKESARLNAMRELCEFDSDLAERQLARFEDPVKQQWAVQEMVSTYANKRKWSEVNNLMKKLRMSRQRVKALGSIAAERKKEGNVGKGRSAYEEAIRTINNIEYLDQKALACAEFGGVQAEHGYLPDAELAFTRAFNLLKNAEQNLSKKNLANRYVTVMSALSSICKRFQSFMPMMEKAIDLAKEALVNTPPAPKNETRVRMLRALAKWGHFGLAEEVLREIDGPEARRRATGLFSAYKLRWNPESKVTAKLIELAADHESRLEVVGRSSVERTVTDPIGALEEICTQLYTPRGSSAWRWGRPKIMVEAGSTLSFSGRSAEKVFEKAAQMVESDLHEHKRGWFLVDLASARLLHGDKPRARQALERARMYPPGSEEDEVRLLATIEALEMRHELRQAIEIECNGVFNRVWAFSNDNLPYKLHLLLRLIRPFANSSRKSELEEICSFACEHLNRDAYHLLPEERCELAGEFAAELAMSTIDMPTLYAQAAEFTNICKAIVEGSKVSLPETVLRAESMLAAGHDIQSGVRITWRIPSGKERSKALRDLCIHAIRRGNYEVIPSSCREMFHHRSEHLADLAWKIVEHDSPTNGAACELFKRLVLNCSDYPDAAYRAVAALIRYFKPQPEVILAILNKLRLLPDA